MDNGIAPNSKLISIAKKTGVTPKQVRDVILNNNVLIPDKTYRAIIGALIEGGEGTYDCIIVRSGKQQRTPPRLTNDYVGNLINAMNETLASTPYRISYHVGNREAITADIYDEIFQKNPDSGLISIIPHNIDLLSDVCRQHQRPCIFIDYQGDRRFEREYVINISNRRSIKVAMQHLFDLGHRRIAFITGMLSMTSAAERLSGYEDALAEAGIGYDPSLVKEGNWSSDTARELTYQLLQLPDRPTAIVASNDVMASGVIIAAREKGLNIPSDISVIGFDDIPMAEDIVLTTIRQPISMIGQHAVQLMVALLDGQTVSQHEYDFLAELIIRGTTSPIS